MSDKFTAFIMQDKEKNDKTYIEETKSQINDFKGIRNDFDIYHIFQRNTRLAEDNKVKIMKWNGTIEELTQIAIETIGLLTDDEVFTLTASKRIKEIQRN